MARITPDILARACQENRIPVELVSLGPRSRFVRVVQFRAWLVSRAAPTDVDLFN